MKIKFDVLSFSPIFFQTTAAQLKQQSAQLIDKLLTPSFACSFHLFLEKKSLQMTQSLFSSKSQRRNSSAAPPQKVPTINFIQQNGNDATVKNDFCDFFFIVLSNGNGILLSVRVRASQSGSHGVRCGRVYDLALCVSHLSLFLSNKSEIYRGRE